jgi:hypothetical protein
MNGLDKGAENGRRTLNLRGFLGYSLRQSS